MNKIYRVTLIVLLLILFSANIVFFAYDGRLVSYLKFDIELEDPQIIINKTKAELRDNPESSIFDLSVFDKDSFKDLKDFQVDLSDFDIPEDLLPEDGDDEEPVEKDPEFEVGNPNPFLPKF